MLHVPAHKQTNPQAFPAQTNGAAFPISVDPVNAAILAEREWRAMMRATVESERAKDRAAKLANVAPQSHDIAASPMARLGWREVFTYRDDDDDGDAWQESSEHARRYADEHREPTHAFAD